MRSILVDLFAVAYNAAFVAAPLGYLWLAARRYDRAISSEHDGADAPVRRLTLPIASAWRPVAIWFGGFFLLLGAEVFVYGNAHAIVRAAAVLWPMN